MSDTIGRWPTMVGLVVTPVTPLSTTVGCWAVIASFSADAYPSAHLGQPYWATPPVIIAALIYLAMVLLGRDTIRDVILFPLLREQA